jgi:hypothetical protein
MGDHDCVWDIAQQGDGSGRPTQTPSVAKRPDGSASAPGEDTLHHKVHPEGLHTYILPTQQTITDSLHRIKSIRSAVGVSRNMEELLRVRDHLLLLLSTDSLLHNVDSSMASPPLVRSTCSLFCLTNE